MLTIRDLWNVLPTLCPRKFKTKIYSKEKSYVSKENVQKSLKSSNNKKIMKNQKIKNS